MHPAAKEPANPLPDTSLPDPRDAPNAATDEALYRIWYYDKEIHPTALRALRNRFQERWGYFPSVLGR